MCRLNTATACVRVPIAQSQVQHLKSATENHDLPGSRPTLDVALGLNIEAVHTSGWLHWCLKQEVHCKSICMGTTWINSWLQARCLLSPFHTLKTQQMEAIYVHTGEEEEDLFVKSAGAHRNSLQRQQVRVSRRQERRRKRWRLRRHFQVGPHIHCRQMNIPIAGKAICGQALYGDVADSHTSVGEEYAFDRDVGRRKQFDINRVGGIATVSRFKGAGVKGNGAVDNLVNFTGGQKQMSKAGGARECTAFEVYLGPVYVRRDINELGICSSAVVSHGMYTDWDCCGLSAASSARRIINTHVDTCACTPNREHGAHRMLGKRV